MKKLITLLLLFFAVAISSQAQELYVFTEPASNMPSKTLSFKLTGRYPQGNGKQRYMPEVMLGINKNWMVHASTTLSDYYSDNIRWESARVYGKYRFFSNDDIHKHFRMAAFGDVALTNNPYLYNEVNLEGDNDGAQVGLIATQLISKVAISGTAAYTRVFNGNSAAHEHDGKPSYHMLNYSLSAGYLVLPKDYTDYNQTNLNVYFEVLGMRSLDQKHYAIDFAPAIQVIVKSNTKINLGYRFQATGSMTRIAEKSFQVSLEHTLFNILK